MQGIFLIDHLLVLLVDHKSSPLKNYIILVAVFSFERDQKAKAEADSFFCSCPRVRGSEGIVQVSLRWWRCKDKVAERRVS